MSAVPEIQTELLDRYQGVPTGVVTDALGRLGVGGWMNDVLPLNSERRVVGRARTAMFAPRMGAKRSLSIYDIIQGCDPGDVIVIATGGTSSWLLGENIAHFAMYHGLAGIVTDGRVRDSDEVRALEIPVFCCGVSARPPSGRLELVGRDVTVDCGEAQVRPGDLVVGDADGIVVVPTEAADALVAEMADLAQLEAEQEKAIREGSFADLQSIRARKKKRKGPPLEIAGGSGGA